jgi:hypothetical protein
MVIAMLQPLQDPLRRFSDQTVISPSYIVFTDGVNYYAKNGLTGQLEFNDKNASNVIQYAVNNTTTGIVWVKGIDRSTVSWTDKSGVAVLFDYWANPISSWLSRYKFIRVLTNAGWSTSNAGSGAISQTPFYIATYTGTTPNSRGLAYAYVFGLNSGDITKHSVDWTKYLELHFLVARLRSDPQVIARVQLKEANTEGALAQRGIGIEIDNYTLIGEGYGTTRGTVDLGTTLSDDIAYRIKLVLRYGTLEFWVNNVLKGTLSESYVPYVKGTASYLVASIINGSTGGVYAYLYLSNPYIIQEW